MANSIIIKAAIDIMGGYSATAKKISAGGKALTYQAVQSWVKQENIPARYVLDVSRETGISPEALNPEVFKKEKSQGIGLGIGSSLELLENVVLIEKQLRLLDSDKSEKLNVTTYKALLDAKEANYLLKEYFPFSTFSPYVEIFLKVTGEMQQSSLIEVLKALQLAIGQEENKKNMVRSRKNDREKQEQLSRYIKSLFIASPSLLVIDLDVSYADEWDYNQPLKMLPESTDQKEQTEESVRRERIEKVQCERNELITQLKKKYKKDLVGYIWKLDYSIEKNFHYNMIYFLDGEKYQNDLCTRQK